MIIKILLFLLLGLTGFFCLFMAQVLKDKRTIGRYQLRLFWDFRDLNDREKKVLMLGICFLCLSLFVAIFYGGR